MPHKKFLDADAKRPFASVSVRVDVGNRVVFGSTESYIEHVSTEPENSDVSKTWCVNLYSEARPNATHQEARVNWTQEWIWR